jgi:hypothetical protein
MYDNHRLTTISLSDAIFIIRIIIVSDFILEILVVIDFTLKTFVVFYFYYNNSY